MKGWTLALAALVANFARADERMTLTQYVAAVGKANLELAASRLNIPIAKAQIAIAKVFPDPVLTVAGSSLNWVGAPPTASVGLNEAIELGGKRSARVAAATAGSTGAQFDAEDFFRTLRGIAANAFIEALHARLRLEAMRQSLGSLDELVRVNELRVKAGDIGEVPLIQSRVEAQRFRGEVVSAQARLRSAQLAMLLQLSGPRDPIFPVGDLRKGERSIDEAALIAMALANRPDLQSKVAAVEAARARTAVARANRWTDLIVGVSFSHTYAAQGIYGQLAPSIRFDALGVSLSLPLPFSRVYRGELEGALAQEEQARLTLDAAGLRVSVEVRTAYALYRAADERLALYTGGVLSDADEVLTRTLYSYQRGAASLLEVLEAQRTGNEVHLAYFDALADRASALVGLELAVGTWDLTFDE